MHAVAGRRQAPYAPPLVALSSGQPAHLLAWELLETTGDWQAWVSWVQTAGGHHAHQIAPVRASSLQPLEEPDAYRQVPRRVHGRDGLIRPWSGEAG